MKKLLAIFFLMLSVSSNVNAEEGSIARWLAEKNNAVKITNDIFSKETLYQHYLKHFEDGNNCKAFQQMMGEISNAMVLSSSLYTTDRLEYSKCSDHCQVFGSSVLFKTNMVHTHSHSLVSTDSETKKCKAICKDFISKYNGYYEGVLDTLKSSENKKTSDCSGVVSGAQSGK